MSRNYDNWEKLVGVVLRRENDRQLAYCESFSTCYSGDLSSRFSFDSAVEDADNFRFNAFVGDVHRPAGNSIDEQMDESRSSNRDVGFQPFMGTMPDTPESNWKQQNESGTLCKTMLALKGQSSNLKSFTFSDLKNATRNFRPDSFLGEGGFGYVFKGWIDEQTFAPCRPGTGLVVAVKKLKAESVQGHREWLTEVNYLGLLHHENLVKLIGYCSESEKRLLVYEYMPKGSLENHLFRKGVQLVPWATRMRIAVDVARGLSFLHSLDANVIYRDLKASNVLLDSEFNAKLSDFGLAREGPKGDRTHVSTRVVGTRGYAAPEYVATGHLTPKSDVYSFGVVLLELLSGKRAYENAGGAEETLVEWTRPFLNDSRKLLRIMDSRLGGQYSKKGAQAAAAIAVRCLTTDPKCRPTMTEVLADLQEIQASTTGPRISPQANKEISSMNHRTVREIRLPR